MTPPATPPQTRPSLWPDAASPAPNHDRKMSLSSVYDRKTSLASNRDRKPSSATIQVGPGVDLNKLYPVMSPEARTIRPETKHSVDIDDYFAGPLDPTKHRKLPYFMRLHGSIMPKLAIPLIFVAMWATAVTCIHRFVTSLAVDSVLLTVLGFVVGLSLSFRSSTAYERYNEGRKFWAQLILHSRNLARIMWVHVKEREGPDGKDDLLCKLSAINLIMAFAQSVKHKLRHEPEYDYPDLQPLIDNLQTFSKAAHDPEPSSLGHRTPSSYETWGEYLGIPFCQSNPQKAIKIAAREGKHHGNLPFEIMTYISAYVEYVMVGNSTMTAPVLHTQVMNSMLLMMDAFGGCERVLATPLPVAYNIAISQITWLYVLVLPFQLVDKLQWVAVPGTIVAAYIILGIAAIGREIENPFGRDVNDLDLDRYCQQLQMDLNILTAVEPPRIGDWVRNEKNQPLWPYSISNWYSWNARSMDVIRKALWQKVDHQSAALVEDGVENSSKRTEKKVGMV